MVFGMAGIDERLLEKMVCPISHAPLVQVDDWLYSTDAKTRRKYPIRDGIPIMLIDESQVVDEDEFQRVVVKANAESKPRG